MAGRGGRDERGGDVLVSLIRANSHRGTALQFIMNLRARVFVRVALAKGRLMP